MCGRFALNHSPSVLQEWYGAVLMPDYQAHYNIAPGSQVLAVRDTPQGRAASMMRWGFIPAWASDLSTIPMLNNARGETLAEKPMFRPAFRQRRCLIPASGFYEWKAVPGQRTKQPFYVSFDDGSPMSFAGLWEKACGPDGTPIETCTIITTEANAALEAIHPRMPLILDREDWDAWLSTGTADEPRLKSLIRPYADKTLRVWGVTHAVNRVTNDNPDLLEPIA